ncbi:anthranilate synthase component I [Chroococcidiopsis sp. TS-821]|uniref:anthranilate synthase component I n=1 Tax=Chroococcidiopsis sp. TS-821 TaxID=1378066 RepID=UPI000CEE4A48|nr:anthranilate synthase component I [Chroococcidiopsis sp. TS-821]PPS45499.1 aminodeoxychorismate synthase component I [Chroococcidiopsis sp. TS-821]
MQPWYWRSLPLKNRTGTQIFAALFAQDTIAALLESPYPSPPDRLPQARYSLCAGKPRTINGCLQMWIPAVGEVLPCLRQRLLSAANQLVVPPHSTLPFTGGWLGWLGYDLAWEIERLPTLKQDSLPFPVAFWYEPECFAVLDHWQQILYLATSDPQQLDQLEHHLVESPSTPLLAPVTSTRGTPARRRLLCSSAPLPPYPPSLPHFLTSQTEYENIVWRAKKYIQAGDIFQANLSLRFETETIASGWEIYQTLHKINPSPFASYWRSPWGEIASCSPERLVQLVGQQATTRPIAGTRPRGTTPESDRQLAQELRSNTKERAEHIMLVDLERNDLGRVCTWGSVVVDELLAIERYSHVMHLVSNIKGTLKADYSPIDLIQAMFPGGTITGCPKVRCMEIIEELEPVRRNLFYGSCGYLDWRGNIDLNILIRTLLLAPTSSTTTPATLKVWGQVGAGIVADSNPEKEWHESLYKAQAQLAALNQTRGEE